MHIAAYLLVAVMLGTGALYLGVASEEYADHQQEAQANTDTDAGESENAEAQETGESAGFGEIGVVLFFTIVGAKYLLIGLWMLRNNEISNITYVIALIGSAALILFYVATRTVNIPMIGLQDDVGVEDLTAKVLQGAIVAISGFMLFAISKHRKKEQLA